MIIGIPKEIKANEKRVSVTPSGVELLKKADHEVYIETNAGIGSGFSDNDYINAGAKILKTAKEVFDVADMIVKVKEPLSPEFSLIKENQILFTYLHLAPEPELTKVLIEKKVIGIAYETVQLEDNSLPLLTPMSEIAGRMSVQIGSRLLEDYFGGRGLLLGGVPGTLPAKVVILGGGVVGTNAIKIALGMGADVTVMDVNLDRLRYLNDIFGDRLKTLMSSPYNLRKELKNTDLLVGAVLIPGARAPKLVTEEMVKNMPEGSVIVDVAIDQGGSVETIDRVTTHENPTYVKHGVIHYSVANMPGTVPRTSTIALTNATLPYVLEIAKKGFLDAIKSNPAIKKGVNVFQGALTYKSVADALNLEYVSIDNLL